jgi:hypothetical protein
MPDVDVTVRKKMIRHRDFDCRRSSRMNSFSRVWSEIQHLRSAHSWEPEMRLTLRPRTTKTGIEILGHLNEPIRVAKNFSLFLGYREISGTRHVIASRSSGFPLM